MTTYREHTVVQGEDVISVAQLYRVRPEDIWDDPRNEALKKDRKDPNVLYPGDVLAIPIPDDPRKADIATGKRHTFRRKGGPQKLSLVFVEDDTPRSGLPYVLVVENERFEGTTGKDGRIEHPVPSTARRGRLTLGSGEAREEYEVLLGHLDPVDTDSGLRARLVNVGFLLDPEADELGLERAIEAFQEHYKLKPTGKANTATRAKLVEAHGS
jgi:hypothetical protein